MNIQEQVLPTKNRFAVLKDVFIQETAPKHTEECFLDIKSHTEQDATMDLWDHSDDFFNETEKEIIQSHPANLHYLLKSLLKLSKMTSPASSYTQKELANFKHNMRHIFVQAVNYEGGWHSADLRTLWADGWREADIVRFMMAKKVKYIMCNNGKLITCLNLEGGVFYFER
jgi:hypothetical protein